MFEEDTLVDNTNTETTTTEEPQTTAEETSDTTTTTDDSTVTATATETTETTGTDDPAAQTGETEEDTVTATDTETTGTDDPIVPTNVIVDLSSFTGDEATGKIHLQETAEGITFTVQDVTPTADIRGVFFNIADDSLLGGLTVSGTNVSNSAFGSENGDQLSQDATVTPQTFEGNVEIGTAGIGQDDIATTSFTLSHESEQLTLDRFVNQSVGLRLTSVGTDSREGSSKLEGMVSLAATTGIAEETPEEMLPEELAPEMAQNEMPTDGESGMSEEEAEMMEEVENSGVFDEEAYLEMNSDVAEAVATGQTTAIAHFVKYGITEKREFSYTFSVSDYLELNSDVAAAVEAGQTSVFAHFKNFGKFEKREFNKFFSVSYYLQQSADVAQAVEAGQINVFDHFKNFGKFERRAFHPLIDISYYLEQNADVAEAVRQGLTTAFEHFSQFGCREKREFNRFFNVSAYLQLNQDVSEAVAQGLTTAFEHFLEFGRFENREFSFSFSISELTSIFSVSSIAEINIEQLFSFLGSEAGQELIGDDAEDDLGDDDAEDADGADDADGDDADGDDADGDDSTQGSGPDIIFDNNGSSGGSSGGQTPDDTDDGTDDGTDGEAGEFDIDYVLETYGEQLQAQFPDFDFENLTEEQIAEIQAYAGEEGLETAAPKPAPAPTALLNFQYIVETYLEQLKAQFPEITDFNKLTAEQAEQIQEYVAEEGLSPSPFVNVSYFESTVKLKVEAQLLAQGMTEEQIASMSQEELLQKSLELGFSPTPLVDLSYCKSANAEKLTKLAAKLGIDISTFSNKELFEFIVKEGLEAGLNPSPFFSIGYIKKLYKEQIRSFYNIADGAEGVAELETGETLDNVFDNGAWVIDLKYYRVTYSAELDAYAKELLGDEQATAEDLSDEQVNAYALNEGMDADLSLSPFDLEEFSEQYTAELKAFYKVESIAKLSQYEIYQFMVGGAIEQGLDVAQYIDVTYYQSTFEAALIATFEVTAISEVTAEQVVDFMFGDAAPYVDEEYYKLKYGEETTEDGTLVKDLSGEELKFYVFSAGWTAGSTTLCAFDIEAISTDTTIQTKLLAFYSVTSIEEVSEVQIVNYIVEEGWKLGIDLSQFVSAEDVELYRTENQALLAEYYGITVEEVANLSADIVLDFEFGGVTDAVDFDYMKFALGEEMVAYFTEQGETIADASQLTKLQVVEYLQAQDTLETVKLSAFDIKGYVSANAEAIAEAFGVEVEQVSEIEIEKIEKFMLTEGVELGLSLEGLVDVAYFKEAYAVAIAEAQGIEIEEVADLDDAAIVEWVSSDLSSVDVDFVAYQFEQLTETQQTDLLTGLGIEVAEGASLSTAEFLQIAYSAEFKAVLQVEQVKLSAIDIDTYIEDNAEALIAFYGEKSGIKIKTGSKKFKTGSLKFGSGSLKTKSGSKKLKGGSKKLKSGSLKLASKALDDASSGEFDVSKLTDKQVIKFMFQEGWTQGIDPLQYVEIDYLKEEFKVELAQHYDIEVSAVAELQEGLVLDFMYGGLSDDIDYEFVRSTYESQLTSQFGVAIDQVTDLQVLEFVYTQGPAEVEISPVDVKGFVAEYGDELVKLVGGDVSSATFNEEDILSFMFNKASEEGIDVSQFVKFEYYSKNFTQNIVFNYRLENVYQLEGDAIYDYMSAEGIGEGLNTSPAIDLEWYRTEYATVLQENLEQIDVDTNGEISNQELFDYVTGAGLENGQDPSELIDFESYLAEGSASAQDVLTAFGASSLSEVSYAEVLEYMLTDGLEAGHAPAPGIDVAALKTQNADALTKFYNVSSIEEVTNIQAFNYVYGAGYQVDEMAMV